MSFTPVTRVVSFTPVECRRSSVTDSFRSLTRFITPRGAQAAARRRPPAARLHWVTTESDVTPALVASSTPACVKTSTATEGAAVSRRVGREGDAWEGKEGEAREALVGMPKKKKDFGPLYPASV